MLVNNIKGLKYPDEYFTQFFFKNRLDKSKPLKFIEFGMSNGNNLLLPYQFGHSVIGIDQNNSAIEDAKHNFSAINLPNEYNFYTDDIRNFNFTKLQADVFMLPNIINYIQTDELIELLENMMKNNNIKKDSLFFIRCRTNKDFRYGIGTKVAENTFLIPNDYNITNEAGCLNRFYTQVELISILEKYLNLKNFHIFTSDSQNLQSGNTTVLNSDMIIWGKIN